MQRLTSRTTCASRMARTTVWYGTVLGMCTEEDERETRSHSGDDFPDFPNPRRCDENKRLQSRV